MAHESNSTLSSRLEIMAAKLPLKSEWRHYRTYETYAITGHAIIEATDQVAVLYICRDGDFIPMIRPANEWLEEVTTAGVIVPRFTPTVTPDGLRERALA